MKNYERKNLRWEQKIDRINFVLFLKDFYLGKFFDP
jgi:hypothetical protein